MISLQADNRPLESMENFSYLSDNYNSGVSSFVVQNSDDFAINDYLLLSQFGSKAAEIVKITGLAKSTNTITTESPTKYPHTESTRVTKLRYNMIRWYHGETADWDTLPSSPDHLSDWQYLGDDTTQWAITDAGSGRWKFQWTGVGKRPRVLDYFPYPIPTPGSIDFTITISGGNFNANNQVNNVIVYEVGEDGNGYGYFIIPATGSAETVTTGTGVVKVYTEYVDITVDSFFTRYNDLLFTTGFGYLGWWNSTTHIQTIVKSPIPYAGFPANTAKAIIDDFFSTLNSNELKLISRTDAFTWLSEGYSEALNELNLVNKEYSAEVPLAITYVAGTTEYALPANFSRTLEVWKGDVANGGEIIDSIRQSEIEAYKRTNNTKIKYYLRGIKDLSVMGDSYIGLVGDIDDGTIINVRYIPKATPQIQNYSGIYLPNNNFYMLKDFIMFRASPKLGKGSGADYYKLFEAKIQKMKLNSIKQDNGIDSFSIADNANV